jgi:class 3 adenylate cyclase
VFEEVEGLPGRDKLTFTNGFYGTCSALFIDIRDSSGLATKYKRPTLAKIYRAFISEMVALLNSDLYVREVNIVGDCVWAVYNTPLRSHIDDIFSIAVKANSLSRLLNYHLNQKDLDPLRFGIGIEWGRALMVKAGYNGSGINDVVYMGDVVNEAAHLAHEAGRAWRHPLYIGGDFQGNLNDDNKAFLSPQYVQGLGTVYTGDVINSAMDDYVARLEE